jgi:hypothetical protein
LDIIVRIVRCRIDPNIVAAGIMIMNSLAIFSLIVRLSPQRKGKDYFEVLADGPSNNMRVLTRLIPRSVGNAIVWGSFFLEPWNNVRILLALNTHIFLGVVYIGIGGK